MIALCTISNGENGKMKIKTKWAGSQHWQTRHSAEYVLRWGHALACILVATFSPHQICTKAAAGGETVGGTQWVSRVLDRSGVLEWGTAGEPLHGEEWAHSWKGDSRCLCLCCLCGRGEEFKKKKSVLQRRQTLWSACLLKVLWNFSPSGTSLPIKANKRGNCSWRGHDDSGISRRSKATLSRSHPAQKNIPQSVYIKTPCPSSGWVPRVTVNQRCRGKELLQLLWDGKIA